MRNYSVLVLMELYDHRIRQGIGRFAKEQGWYLTFCDGCTHSGNVLPQGWRGDGILTQISQRPEILRYVKTQNVPCVDMSLQRPDVVMPRISGDHLLIGAQAAEHLLERGFVRAAYFATEDMYPHKLREQGFAQRFQTGAGQQVKSLVWMRQSRNGLDNWQAQNKWLKKSLDKLPKPLGIFCYSDYDAVKIETISLELGYNIPEDVAILGVDNDPLVCENVKVPLSSVRHDLVRVGYDGAAMLHKLMLGLPEPSETILVPPRGVETRTSTETFTADDPLVRRVINFFRERISESVGAPEAAKALDIPLHKLKAAFTHSTNLSPYAILLQLRLLEARRLLLHTNCTVKEIAARTGFCHAQHLNNMFRHHEKCTPTEYRSRER